MRNRRPTHRWEATTCALLVLATGPTLVRAQEALSITLSSASPCFSSLSARVNLTAAAPGTGLTIRLTSTAPANAVVPEVINALPGATSADFQVNCVSSDQYIGAVITAMVQGTTRMAKTIVNVSPPSLNAITFDADTGAAVVVGRVTLIGPAPEGGVVVALASSDTVARVPALVTVPAGASSMAISATTGRVSARKTVSISATAFGVAKGTSLTIIPPIPKVFGFPEQSQNQASAISQTGTITGSEQPRLMLKMSRGVSPDYRVVFSSSNPTAVQLRQVPRSDLKRDLGDSIVLADLSTTSVSQITRVTLSATAFGVSRSCIVTLLPPGIASLSLSANSVVGGQTVVGTIEYSAPAPVGGTTVRLLSSNSGLVKVSSSATVPAGQTQVTFKIFTSTVRSRASVIVSVESYGQTRTMLLELVP